MSSMLEQAIIDADQLKETAKQTAEEAVVEKYQDEIKEAIEKILEQDEVDAELTVDDNGAPELELVDELPAVQTAVEEEIVQIDLNQLEEMMAQELEEGDLDSSDMLDREQVAEELESLAEENADEEVELDESLDELLAEDEEEVEINEESIAALVAEMLSEEDNLGMPEDAEEQEASEEEAEAASAAATGKKVADVESLEEEAKPDYIDLDGDGDKEESMKKAAEDKKKAGKRDTRDDMGGGHGDYKVAKEKPDFPYRESKELQKENKSLIKEQKRAERKVQLLQEKVDKYGTVITQLKEKLNESNLTSAKLLYQNRILNSVSLNERQKDKIVEAISNATTVEEAKLIFETLQSAVGVSKRKQKKPESLNEVVTRSSSAFIPRQEVKPSSDAFSERMKRLAGLK